ncbi:MAG: hypothetical protein ACM34I_01325 [bacterium]
MAIRMLTRRDCIHLIGGAGIALSLAGCAWSLQLQADRVPQNRRSDGTLQGARDLAPRGA